MLRAPRFLGLLLTLAGLLVVPGWLEVPHSEARPRARSLSTSIVGRPIVGGHYLFWLQRDRGNPHPSLYAHDTRRQTTFVLPAKPLGSSPLASDGTIVAWIERDRGRGERIQAYNLQTAEATTLLTAGPPRSFAALALDQGVLYYQDTGQDRRGIYARSLATGQEQLITRLGRNPVAADGVLLWSEEQFQATYLPVVSRLHLRRTDGSAPDRVLATGSGSFSGYSVSGDRVVWSFFPPERDRRVQLYQISAAATTAISAGPARYPLIHGDAVVWTTEPDAAPGQTPRWSVQRYQLDDGSVAAIADETAGPVATWALLDEANVAFAVDHDPTNGKRQLLLSPAQDPAAPLDAGVQPPAAPASASSPSFSTCGPPLVCGQVYKRGFYLYDNGGRWPVNGVQFFLPQFGINGWTFRDANYWSSTGDIDRWLDVARDYLGARTLRIFVDPPSATFTPTSHATIYDFAQRAQARGMRIGLVLYNGSGFTMSAERRAWLGDLITYFDDRDATSLLAYVSASNEINNHCGGNDCFDTNAAYVDSALEWVSQFTGIFQNSGILTTVGISTEVTDSNGKPAWYDFHHADSSGRTLADMVDFISPHNYGGAGYGIFNDLRYVLAYQGPIVLEEYGYPTDPRTHSAFFTDGVSVCREDPFDGACINTAPYFVEINTRALRETSYAGGAAWMLADIERKRCDSDPSDLWTGLFVAGYGYCGGTSGVTSGADKATAFRVKIHHGVYGGPPSLTAPTATATATSTSTATATSTSTATATSTPTATSTTTVTPTSAPLPPEVTTAVPTNTLAAVPPTTSTPTSTATSTPLPTSTSTATATSTATSTPTATSTATTIPTAGSPPSQRSSKTYIPFVMMSAP